MIQQELGDMSIMIHLYLRLTQKFVGGALTSLTGMQVFGMEKATYLGEMTGWGKQKMIDGKLEGYKYLLKDKMFDKFLSYGLQSMASDFAYTERKYYKERSFMQHIGTFMIGGFNGAIQSVGFETKHSFFGYGLDYFMQSLNQGYEPLGYSKGWRKTGIFSLKAFFLRPN